MTFKITLEMKNAPIDPNSHHLWQNTLVLSFVLSSLMVESEMNENCPQCNFNLL